MCYLHLVLGPHKALQLWLETDPSVPQLGLQGLFARLASPHHVFDQIVPKDAHLNIILQRSSLNTK